MAEVLLLPRLLLVSDVHRDRHLDVEVSIREQCDHAPRRRVPFYRESAYLPCLCRQLSITGVRGGTTGINENMKGFYLSCLVLVRIRQTHSPGSDLFYLGQFLRVQSDRKPQILAGYRSLSWLSTVKGLVD